MFLSEKQSSVIMTGTNNFMCHVHGHVRLAFMEYISFSLTACVHSCNHLYISISQLFKNGRTKSMWL
jgi:hypothetical protein